MNGGVYIPCILGAPSAFQNLLDSCGQAAGTKPQCIIHVLQKSQTQQQSNQENDITKRKNEKAMHFKTYDVLRSSLSMKHNSLYFAFPIIFNNSVLRKINP